MREKKDNKQTTLLPLRRERELRGWSRSYVAQLLEVDAATVGRWERGERLPHPDHRQKLCELFGKSTQELGFYLETLEGTDDQEIVSDPPPLEPAGNKRPKYFHSPFRPRRRTLLIGLGSFGSAILVGSIWRAASLSLPPAEHHVSAIQKKLLHQIVDPNTKNWINNLACSPNGNMLAAANGINVTTIWDIRRFSIVYYYPTLQKWINDISWSKSNFLATANAEFSAGSIQVWQFSERKTVFTLRRSYAIRTVSWSPTGDYLAFAGHATTVEVWNPFTARLINSYTYANSNFIGINKVKWSSDARYIAAAGDNGTVHVWETTTGKLVTVYGEHQGRVMDIAWCPGEYLIASASTDQTAQVWDALKGKTIVTYAGHKGEVHGIDWSPNRKYVVSGSYDTTAQVWDALTGRNIYTYPEINDKIMTVSWLANGALIAVGGQEKGIEMWQAPQ